MYPGGCSFNIRTPDPFCMVITDPNSLSTAIRAACTYYRISYCIAPFPAPIDHFQILILTYGGRMSQRYHQCDPRKIGTNGGRFHQYQAKSGLRSLISIE